MAGGDVVEALFARGSVVYRADQDEDDVYELYLASPRVPFSAPAR